ncbi:hypothetical protein KEM55_007276, partial [Ascosphaera atra]
IVRTLRNGERPMFKDVRRTRARKNLVFKSKVKTTISIRDLVLKLRIPQTPTFEQRARAPVLTTTKGRHIPIRKVGQLKISTIKANAFKRKSNTNIKKKCLNSCKKSLKNRTRKKDLYWRKQMSRHC